MHKLEAKGLKKTIKKTPIVRGMSLKVNSGEVVGLLGPNGAGKTTTFYMICGLVESTEGEVFFDDDNISDLPLHKRAVKGIGYLPQESSIFKKLTVKENILAILEALPGQADPDDLSVRPAARSLRHPEPKSLKPAGLARHHSKH